MKAKKTTLKKPAFPRRRGRPCLLNPRRMRRFLAAIKNSMPLKHAAAFAGVSYDTVNRWRIRGEDEKSPVEFCNFYKALKRAQAVAMNRLLRSVQRSGRKDWRAAAWLLERRHAEDFGKINEVEKPEQFKSSLPSTRWDNHPVKQEIRENEEVRFILSKIRTRMLEEERKAQQRKRWEEEDREKAREDRIRDRQRNASLVKRPG